MKKIIYLLLLFSAFANAQIVNIPDANFKATLLAYTPNNHDINGNQLPYIDTNSNGEIEVSEALQVGQIFIYNSAISNITGIEFFTNLTYLNVQSASLSSINVSSLINLESLVCSNSQLTQLDVSSLTNLNSLDCSFNDIESLNLSNLVNLKYLLCQYNNISTINFSPSANFIKINCEVNNLSNLNVNNFTQLNELICSHNYLSSLNVSNLSNLNFLFCGYNQLTSLNISGLINLKSLQCYNNLLTSLNLSGPITLQYLGCQDNLLTDIDFSPLYFINSISVGNPGFNTLNLNSIGNNSGFTWLSFWGGVQTTIDLSMLPNLERVSLYNTSLTSVDISQNSKVDDFYAFYCLDLSYINLKNGLYSAFNFESCPSLDFICVDENELINTQNQLNTGGANSVVCNSYCSFNPGGNFNTITGSIIYDENGGGCEATDLPQPNIKIDINDGVNQGATFTNNSGNYNFYTEAGNFTITPNMENPTWYTVSPTSATIPFANDNNNTVTHNFCLSPNGIHPDLEIVVAPIVPARPGFDAIYKIVYKNKGNQTLSQAYGVNFFYNENVMDYVSASVAPTSMNSGGLSWSYTNLLPFESRSVLVTFSINTPTDTTPVNIGDVLQFTTSILPMAGDESTFDNTFLLNQTVVGAYDPNDITCLEGNVVSPSLIGEYLHYVINFENTGNYEAENIVVKTEINPAQFDVNSLRMLNTSHDAYIRINNNIVEFVFENIALESGGHGNILLKVKSKGNLTNGAIVKKRADIFFDYNAPIDTGFENTVFQALSNSGFIKDNSISIYPNPTNSVINIKCDNTIKSIELFDVQGRVLVTKMVSDYSEVLDISNKANGIYFLKITSENGIKIEKLIKE